MVLHRVEAMVQLLLTVYFVVLGVLALLGVHRLHLTWIAFFRNARRRTATETQGAPARPPKIAVQLPLYNEALVAERLLRACARLRYPEGSLEIQVLDDSTDETRAIVTRVAAELGAKGVAIRVLRRSEREGYKAGALAYGLRETDAELIAIFDADFVPPPDFLERMVPRLIEDERLGMVQARWGHLNRDVSMLTRAQAIFLDGHFAIEHRARDVSGRFFNFNGTAGVWRRRAIEEAGGWTFDTITEDLDLSYRSQLAGSRFVYLDDVVAPAELPETWAAFRSQQARWVRGSVETAKKHLRRVLSSRALAPLVRLDAAIHLTNNFAYVLMAILALLLPATVIVRSELGWRVPGGRTMLTALDLSMLTAGTLAMIVFYAAAAARVEGRLRAIRLVDLAFALCVGAGMSVSNAREVIAGLFAKDAPFVRTPKRGDASKDVARAVYRARSPLLLSLVELVFAAYFLAALAYAAAWELFAAMPFLILYLVGFTALGAGNLIELLRPAEAAVEPHRETAT